MPPTKFLEAHSFKLELSLCCGQVFGWQRRGEWFYGFIGGKPVKVRQAAGGIEFVGGPDRRAVARYFRLDDDLNKIQAAVGVDAKMRGAIRQSRGLRLLRQDPWECSVSFICSAYSNIPRIEKMLDSLRKRFGKRVVFCGVEMRAFPSPGKLAKATVRDLERCGLGYRAPYVKAFAERVYGGKIDFGALRRMPYGDAKAVLMRERGVGEKVADCILLFSLDRLEAFPVDVWIQRIMVSLYGREIRRLEERGKLVSERAVRRFAQARFGKWAGYAQQYFYAARKCLCRAQGVWQPPALSPAARDFYSRRREALHADRGERDPCQKHADGSAGEVLHGRVRLEMDSGPAEDQVNQQRRPGADASLHSENHEGRHAEHRVRAYHPIRGYEVCEEVVCDQRGGKGEYRGRRVQGPEEGEPRGKRQDEFPDGARLVRGRARQFLERLNQIVRYEGEEDERGGEEFRETGRLP